MIKSAQRLYGNLFLAQMEEKKYISEGRSSNPNYRHSLLQVD